MIPNVLPAEPAASGEIVNLPTADIALTPAEVEKLSLGQPWDEATVIRQVLLHTEHLVHAGLEIGRLLLWSKATLKPGEFDAWVANNFPFKRRSAYRYMQVARFALRHPSMTEPMARLGLLKTLELARLPESIAEELVNGQLPELEPDKLEVLTWPELKKRLAKIESERGELAEKVEDQKKKIEQLQAEEKEEAAAQGRLTMGAQRKVIEKMDKLREEFDLLMADIGRTLDAAAERCATEELDVSVRLRVKGFVQYIQAYADIEEARFRTNANEDITGEEQNEPWDRPRVLDDTYELPKGRAIPFSSDL